MALINKLRNKMGTVVVAVIAVAILSFILADFLGQGGSLFNSQTSDVGEIAGEKISSQQYQSAISEVVQGYQSRTGGREPSQAEMVSLRQQAWDLLISRIGFQEEFDELGLTVTMEELEDMVQGENIDPNLQSQFVNPETGEFDKQSIIRFLASLSAPPQAPEALPVWEQTRAQWQQYEQSLLAGRQRIKFDNLLVKTNYATAAEAQQLYQEETATAEVKYLYVPFYAIADSLVTVTDKELQSYLTEHADAYQVEENRSAKYVTFPMLASAADTIEILEELGETKLEFQTVSDDSAYAQANTDFGLGYSGYTIDRLPEILRDQLDELDSGAVYGPYLENNAYLLYKISDIGEDTVYAARARHILIKPVDESEEAEQEAKAKAQGILLELRAGGDFAQLALDNSEDPSNNASGGDLGWFSSGRMVPEFQEAVFDAAQPGLVNRLVETQFGYHIIDVTNTKTNTLYKIASISREVSPSQTTRDLAYRKAQFFKADSKTQSQLEAAAQKDSIAIFDALKIDKNARSLGALSDARQVVQWLYKDASVGDVSDVFSLDDEYVVAVMTGEQEEGTAALEDVKEEITVKVKNRKKADQIIAKLKGLSGSLEDVASGFGPDAKVYNTADLKLNSNTLPNVGNAPLAVGRAFALNPAQRATPMTEDNGVVIVELVSKIAAPEIADYTQYKDQIRQSLANSAGFGISNAIRDFSEIQDQRYRFY